MSISPRRNAPPVNVGGVTIGGKTPPVVQAMTDTDTADDVATSIQARELAEAGAELVRITVNTPAAADSVPRVRDRLDSMGVNVPLVGDFHYNGHKLLAKHPSCAEALAKYRINPGNVGRGDRRRKHFSEMVGIAIDRKKTVRIGANWGSLDEDVLGQMMDENAKLAKPMDADRVAAQALVKSCADSAALAEKLGLAPENIVLSAKVSRVPLVIEVYRMLAQRCKHALHVGLTEAGMGMRGTVASAAALSILLSEGLCDTIRVSLTPAPGADRREEVRVCWQILQSLGLRHRSPSVTACPGCGRTTSTLFRELAAQVQKRLDERMEKWRTEKPGVERLTVAVMGCVVNGPGESRHANIGISLPGSGENPVAIVYADGDKVAALKGDDIAERFIGIAEDYVEKSF